MKKFATILCVFSYLIKILIFWFISKNIYLKSVNHNDCIGILSHYYFLAFFAFSSAIFLLVLEINESTSNNPTIKARAGTLNR